MNQKGREGENKKKEKDLQDFKKPPSLILISSPNQEDGMLESSPCYNNVEALNMMTLRSMDSTLSASKISINESSNTFTSRSISSSQGSCLSESFVDANEAGLLSGRLLNDLDLHRPNNGSIKSDIPIMKNNITNDSDIIEQRTSATTDPGAGGIGVVERHARNSSSYGHTIKEGHDNFVLMYDMLMGIRHSVSVCQAKPGKNLLSEDFNYARTYNFVRDSKETTPSKFNFRFKDYAPWVFRNLREAFRIDAADYLVSLTGKYALSEIGSPGKSGSLFYFSQDFRYIIKTIRQSEHDFLRKILRHYYEHVKRNPNSLLTRFYGLHRVRMSNVKKIYFVVMGNIFPPHKDIHETYDLKGATLGRFIGGEELAEKELATLKDLNWIQRKRKLRLGPEKATILMNQLKADCMFLSKTKIMDYSLLIGIHYLGRGNQERLRDRSMRMLEPTTPIRGDGQIPSFKQISFSSAIDGASLPQERKMCIFYSEDGGFMSSYRDGSPADELYFLGIIDILTPYSVTKKVEHAFKSIQYDKATISAVNPTDYSKRFLKFMSDNILLDSMSDYANRDLPDIPNLYTSSEEQDGAIVIEDKDDTFT